MTTPSQPEEGLREGIAEIIEQAKAVKINSGEGWGGFTYLTDGKQDIDQILQLFQSTMLSCEPTITMEDIDIPLPTLEEYQKMVWILDLNNRFWRANILKACGGK